MPFDAARSLLAPLTAALGLWLTQAVPSADAQSATAPAHPDADAFGAGQASVRTFQDYLEPGTCGIVLELPRCRADFQAVRRLAGPRAIDAEADAWLQSGDIAHRITHWDGVFVPKSTWSSAPGFAWWYSGGALWVAAGLGRPYHAYVDSIVRQLVQHDDVAPAAFAGIAAEDKTEAEQAVRYGAALHAAIAPVPFPAVSFAPGETGYAQLGVYVSTFQELIDNSLALSRPESRAFALALFDRLDAAGRELDVKLSTAGMRDALSGDLAFEAEKLNANFRRPAELWAHALYESSKHGAAYAIGSLSAQVAYNAAVLKDPQADAKFRGRIAATPLYDGASERVRTALQKLQDASRTDWDQVRASATAVTLAILADGS